MVARDERKAAGAGRVFEVRTRVRVELVHTDRADQKRADRQPFTAAAVAWLRPACAAPRDYSAASVGTGCPSRLRARRIQRTAASASPAASRPEPKNNPAAAGPLLLNQTQSDPPR